MALNLFAPVRSGDLPARILTTISNPIYPIVAVVTHDGGLETVRSFTADGWFSEEGPDEVIDLVNAPETLAAAA